MQSFSKVLLSAVSKPLSLAAGVSVNVVSAIMYDQLLARLSQKHTDVWFGVQQPEDADVETDRRRWQFWASRILSSAAASMLVYPFTKWWTLWATDGAPGLGAYAAGLALGRGAFYQGLLPSAAQIAIMDLEPEVYIWGLVQWLTAAESSTMSLEQMLENRTRKETWSEDMRFLVHSTAVIAASSLATTLVVAPVATVAIHCISRPDPAHGFLLGPFAAALGIFRNEGVFGFYKAAVPLFLGQFAQQFTASLSSIFLTPINRFLADILRPKPLRK